jgi:hypothetical protein
MNKSSMKLLLPSKYLNEQDKRALWLYLVIAVLSAVALAAGLFFASDLHFGKKTEMEAPTATTPNPLSRHP